jgi:hypothetical protein
LSSQQLAGCVEDVQKVIEAVQTGALGEVMDELPNLDDLAILKALLLSLEKAIDAVVIPSAGLSKPGVFFYDTLEQISITFTTAPLLLEVLDKAILALSMQMASNRAYLPALQSLIYAAFPAHYAANYQEISSRYNVHLHLVEAKRRSQANDGFAAPPMPSKNWNLAFWCFDPGLGFNEIASQGVHSIILTSAFRDDLRQSYAKGCVYVLWRPLLFSKFFFFWYWLLWFTI